MTFDLQIFMFRYGLLLFSGIIGSFGTLSFSKYENVMSFVKHLSLAMIYSLVTGLLLMNLLNFSIEAAFACSVLISLFSKKITDEVFQFIDDLNIIVKKLILGKDDDSSSDDEENMNEDA